MAAPDGYTILLAPSDFTLIPSLQAKPPYDPIKDFAPIGMVVDYSHVLVANPNVAASNAKELIALAKANPGQDQLRVGRQRRHQSHLGRAVQAGRRHRHHARAVQGQRAGHRRPAGRSRAAAVHVHRPGRGASEERQAEGDRRHRQDAPLVAARRADDRGERHPRLPVHAVVRPRGAGGHAEAGHRQAERRPAQDDGVARSEGEARHHRRQPQRRLAGRNGARCSRTSSCAGRSSPRTRASGSIERAARHAPSPSNQGIACG